jgi:hypothetical protein
VLGDSIEVRAVRGNLRLPRMMMRSAYAFGS